MGKLTLAPADMPERWAKLKAENDKLRAALETIIAFCPTNVDNLSAEIARKALKE